MNRRLLDPASIALHAILFAPYSILTLLLISIHENHGFSSEGIVEAYSFFTIALFDPSSLPRARSEPFWSNVILGISYLWFFNIHRGLSGVG